MSAERLLAWSAAVTVSVVMLGCAASAPKSFSYSQSPGWSTIELRRGLGYDRAWDTVLEILVKNFEIDQAIRREGYLRTGWLYTWSGEYRSHYRVRVSVKFAPDRTKLQYLPEAQFLSGKEWRVGTDSRLVSTIKTDLMGTVGRTTR